MCRRRAESVAVKRMWPFRRAEGSIKGLPARNLVGKPLEGVRDAEAEGAEALAVALVRGTSRAVVPPTMRSLKT